MSDEFRSASQSWSGDDPPFDEDDQRLLDELAPTLAVLLRRSVSARASLLLPIGMASPHGQLSAPGETGPPAPVEIWAA